MNTMKRYASEEMIQVWSDQNKYTTWRWVWVALAKAEHDMGLPITTDQIVDMMEKLKDIDFDLVANYEKETHHDVVAHIRAFGDAVPSAKGIIHMGATSMDIVDNADLIIMKSALQILEDKMQQIVDALSLFCRKYIDLPTVGMTHLQSAQLTTVGKRSSLWLQDIYDDLCDIQTARKMIKCHGLRGASGTQASYLALLGDSEKVQQMETKFTDVLGFDGCYPVSGQTYSRRLDIKIINTLSTFATTTHKICNDIRLLCMLGEVSEKFGTAQVGSSAMPHKRNPILSERATGLSRMLISLSSSPMMTQASQMLERTLDDSSNKRLVISQSFLLADSIADLLHRIISGMEVHKNIIESRVNKELPFLVCEEILSDCVIEGLDRQEYHEKIKQHAIAAKKMTDKGMPNDLLERIEQDSDLPNPKHVSSENLIGRCVEQTMSFLETIQ